MTDLQWQRLPTILARSMRSTQLGPARSRDHSLHRQVALAVVLCVRPRGGMVQAMLPSRAVAAAILVLVAAGRVKAGTMDCSSYYCGAISGGLTSILDESDTHTLITDQCASHSIGSVLPHADADSSNLCRACTCIRPNRGDRHVRQRFRHNAELQCRRINRLTRRRRPVRHTSCDRADVSGRIALHPNWYVFGWRQLPVAILVRSLE